MPSSLSLIVTAHWWKQIKRKEAVCVPSGKNKGISNQVVISAFNDSIMPLISANSWFIKGCYLWITAGRAGCMSECICKFVHACCVCMRFFFLYGLLSWCQASWKRLGAVCDLIWFSHLIIIISHCPFKDKYLLCNSCPLSQTHACLHTYTDVLWISQ